MEYINLSRRRKFGQKLNATFEFIRQNAGGLFKSILYLAGPLILITSALVIYLQRDLFLITEGNSGDPFAMFNAFSSSFGWTYALSVISTALLIAIVYDYMVLYQTKKSNQIEVSEVWQLVRNDFFRVLVGGFLVSIVVIIGFFLFILPGVILAVLLSPIFIIMVKEKLNVFSAFSRSFNLVSGKWWSTFGIIVVSSVIQLIVTLVLILPFEGIKFLIGFNALEGPDQEYLNNSFFQIIDIAISSVTMLGGYFIYTILLIAIGFQYYNLVELKEASGLMEDIDQIGSEEISE